MPQVVHATIKWSKPILYAPENKKQTPPQPGVYEILVKQTVSGVPVGLGRKYVGQTDDFNRRYGEHLQDDEPNVCVRNYVRDYESYFRHSLDPIRGEDDRKDIEKALFDQHKHKCNEGNPPTGSGRDLIVGLTEIPRDSVVPLP